jgi:hypothetical protein
MFEFTYFRLSLIRPRMDLDQTRLADTARRRGGEERAQGDAPMHTQPRQGIEREQRAKEDKRPLLAANVLVIAEQVDGAKGRVERDKGQEVGVCPARERIVQRQLAHKRRRHKRSVRSPKKVNFCGWESCWGEYMALADARGDLPREKEILEVVVMAGFSGDVIFNYLRGTR